jgi:uncharacterized protein with HEPN domain
MSPNEKNDLLYLLNILEHIGKIWKYTEKTTDADDLFELNEQMNLNASLTLLANIGENVSKISEKLKNEYSNVDWQKIKGFRNRIIHDYLGINLAIVYEIIAVDLKTLKIEIVKIIREKLKQEVFDIKEIEISRENRYYNHVDFEEIL